MKQRSKAPAVVLVAGLLVLAAGLFAAWWLAGQAAAREHSVARVDAFFAQEVPDPFVNSAAHAQPPPAAEKTATALASFQAPEGFTFYSHSAAWDEAMLEQLYQELKRNRHGEEIYSLRQVTVMAETDQSALAYHAADSDTVTFALSFGALPPVYALSFSRGVSDIVLYGGDTNTTVESMAGSLSHEYGHLYTFYYFFPSDTDSLAGSEYARLRDSKAHGLITALEGTTNTLLHHLYLLEVAAEDYVQLMGSPTTRQVANFPDVRQQVAGAPFPNAMEQSMSTNAWPQENMRLPLASEVAGLAEYYYSFLGQDPPQPDQPQQPVTLSITPGSVGFDLVGGYRTFVYYTIGWNTPYADAIYTLVCLDDDDSPYAYPVKTVYPGQAPTATIGTVAYEDGGYVTWQFDGLDEGTKIFYVTALLPDGTYYRSQPLVHTFS